MDGTFIAQTNRNQKESNYKQSLAKEFLNSFANLILIGMNNKMWLKSFYNNHLELILLITEQCNFRCLYCYEDFTIGKMNDETIMGVKNLVLKRIKTLNSLKISFFGGEPLLNKKAIYEISEWAYYLCLQNKVSYSSGLATNGYSLDKSTFINCFEKGIQTYQITLDGEKEAHNKLRPSINGKNTFEKIYSNLIELSKRTETFNCIIRFNVSDSNINSVRDFISFYSLPFANDKRFHFHFHPIFGMENLKLSKHKILQDLKEYAIEKGLYFNTETQEAACYASKANSYVIRADGRIQKCTVALESDINNVGRIAQDGNLKLDQDKLKKWLFANDKECPVQSLTLEKLIIPYENAGKFITNKV